LLKAHVQDFAGKHSKTPIVQSADWYQRKNTGNHGKPHGFCGKNMEKPHNFLQIFHDFPNKTNPLILSPDCPPEPLRKVWAGAGPTAPAEHEIMQGGMGPAAGGIAAKWVVNHLKTIQSDIHTHIIYTYIYICVCVCSCHVCATHMHYKVCNPIPSI
jgi:hypothetical protein